ncbi:alpha/beta fold hydrolase [Mycoplasma sp. P36-A1]|uniref:alpha/beta fold hydrolase n=1 Tax=Mycoplasma sp. P36-A1 TaxID=3252900 RepID=UPI003C2F93F8
MEVTIDNMIINYEEIGHGQPVILMHGWGQNLEMMYSIVAGLKDQYHVYNIDLPGFGHSDEPSKAYTIDDYTNFLEEFVKINNIDNPIIIGHSFGCRIAIKYAARKNPVKEMVLTGAAGLIDKKTPLYYFRVYTYKFFKIFKNVPFIKYYIQEAMDNAGSEDYKNSSPVMKGILKNAVNEDLESYLGKITCPVLLIFGSNDDATPVWMAKVMEDKMHNATLKIYQNATHYAYLENIDRFNKDMLEFLGKEDDK